MQIISFEPRLNCTPEGNPGFDLYENDSTGNPIRWIEVKAMTGSLSDRPVGLLAISSTALVSTDLHTGFM